MNKKIIYALTLVVIIFMQTGVYGEVINSEITVDFKGQPQRVTYQVYTPPQEESILFSVLVCVGGLPSGPDECMNEVWKSFADENHIAILGLGFTFVKEDWPKKVSYQYANAWSGEALLEILGILFKETPINSKELYLFGISAGAQFSIRFAQMRPDISKAVVAHAAGGYDSPQKYIPTKFLITVGEFDNKEVSRLDFAKLFTKAAHDYGIDVQLEIIPSIAHRQTEGQNEMSREFFKKVIK